MEDSAAAAQVPCRSTSSRTPWYPRLLHHHDRLFPPNIAGICYKASARRAEGCGDPTSRGDWCLGCYGGGKGDHLVRLHPRQNHSSSGIGARYIPFKPSQPPPPRSNETLRLQNRCRFQHPLPPLPLDRPSTRPLVARPRRRRPPLPLHHLRLGRNVLRKRRPPHGLRRLPQRTQEGDVPRLAFCPRGGRLQNDYGVPRGGWSVGRNGHYAQGGDEAEQGARYSGDAAVLLRGFERGGQGVCQCRLYESGAYGTCWGMRVNTARCIGGCVYVLTVYQPEHSLG